MSRLLLQAAVGDPVAVRRRATLGSGPGADVFVNDPGVAPLHAVFERRGGGWFVAAREGAVLLDGSPTRDAPLADGQELRVGGVSLRVGMAVRSPRRRLAAPHHAAALGAIVVLALFGAGLAEARPVGGPPVVELEAGGPSRSWEGESDTLAIALPLHHPAQSLVELHVHAPGRERPLSLVVNGSPLREVAATQVVALREHVVAGVNRLELIASGAPLQSVTLRVSVLPLPRCTGGACAAALRATLARAERLEREQRVAPGNLFEAFRLLRKARGLAIASGDQEARGAAEERLGRVEAGLGSRCASLRFAAARHLGLQDEGAARRTARELLATFPTDEHPCRGSGEKLLRLLDEGGR